LLKRPLGHLPEWVCNIREAIGLYDSTFKAERKENDSEAGLMKGTERALKARKPRPGFRGRNKSKDSALEKVERGSPPNLESKKIDACRLKTIF
jgi:hypothetical protein